MKADRRLEARASGCRLVSIVRVVNISIGVYVSTRHRQNRAANSSDAEAIRSDSEILTEPRAKSLIRRDWRCGNRRRYFLSMSYEGSLIERATPKFIACKHHEGDDDGRINSATQICFDRRRRRLNRAGVALRLAQRSVMALMPQRRCRGQARQNAMRADPTANQSNIRC